MDEINKLSLLEHILSKIIQDHGGEMILKITKLDMVSGPKPILIGVSEDVNNINVKLNVTKDTIIN